MRTRRLVLLAAILCFTSQPRAVRGAEETANFAFDGARALEHVVYLASDAMQGRQSCTEGYLKAAQWAAERFAQWGLQPAGENGTFFQDVKCRPFDWEEGMPSLIVNGREFLLDDEDFSVNTGSSGGVSVKGEVVFVGYGISAPDKGLDEYQGLDVTDRIVLAFTGSPANAPLPPRWRGEPVAPREETADAWQAEATDAAKALKACEKGAAALLLFDPDAGEDAQRSRPGRRGAGGRFTPPRPFLSFTIDARVFRAIMKTDPQQSPRGIARHFNQVRREIRDGTVHSRATGIPAALKGFDVVAAHNEASGNLAAPNVLAKLPGTDPVLGREYLVIGAHLDHVGVRNGYVYNGADDNASGSSVVLETARVLAAGGFAPKRTVIFALWAGEEMGLLGSRHYVRQPSDGVTVEAIAASINLDMVGLGERLGAVGALNFPSIWEVTVRGQDPADMARIEPSTGGPGGSDHTPFIERGIQTVFLMGRGGGGHPDYHQPEDDADKICADMLGLAGRFTLRAVVHLAGETQTPLLIANREKQYRGLRLRISHLNPDCPGSAWTVVTVPTQGREAIREDIMKKAVEIVRSGRAQQGAAARSAVRGIADVRGFEGDVDLFTQCADLYGYGRLDLRGDDGVWVKDGRLTEAGKAALRTLQEREFSLRLVSPSGALLDDVLGATTKPFLVTGEYTVTGDMAERLNERRVRLAVDLDTRKVPEFIARVEALKEILGERRNLVAWLTATDDMEEAGRRLYVGLDEKGWAHNEMCGPPRARGGLLCSE